MHPPLLTLQHSSFLVTLHFTLFHLVLFFLTLFLLCHLPPLIQPLHHLPPLNPSSCLVIHHHNPPSILPLLHPPSPITLFIFLLFLLLLCNLFGFFNLFTLCIILCNILLVLPLPFTLLHLVLNFRILHVFFVFILLGHPLSSSSSSLFCIPYSVTFLSPLPPNLHPLSFHP